MDNSLLIPVGGVAFVLLLINIRFVFSIISAQRQKVEDQSKENDALKSQHETSIKALENEIKEIKEKHEKDMRAADRKHRRCDRKNNILMYALQRNQIEIPESFWEEGDD